MNKLLLAASAAVAAVSVTPAQAATSCYQLTVAKIQAIGREDKMDMTPALVRSIVQQKGVDTAAQNANTSLPAACHAYTAANINAYAGLGVASEPSSKPAVIAVPAVTQPAVTAILSAPTGGGAWQDAKIAALEARLAAGNLDADAAREIRAELASLRTQVSNLRSQPAVTRTVTINRGPNATDKAAWDKAATQSTSNTGIIDKLMGYTDPKTGKEVQGVIPSLQEKLFGKDGKHDVIADQEKRLSAAEAKLSSLWTPQWWLFAILVVLGALGTWWLASRKQTGSAPTLVEVKLPNVVTHEELDARLADVATKAELGEAIEGVHGRVDRVAGDLQLDSESAAAMKAAKVGDELEVKFTMDKEPYYKGFKLIKSGAKNFATKDKIGDTPANQDIGDVIGFVRKAHKARRYVLEPFLVSAA